ncbi:MAG: DUF1987 domain-containing protein [Flavobacteriales bacterium]|nr:DUF1987 domain-containing protein [Flavobacteriales bacterium]
MRDPLRRNPQAHQRWTFESLTASGHAQQALPHRPYGDFTTDRPRLGPRRARIHRPFLPHNSEHFYSRVYRWIDEYLEEPREQTTVNMKLDYLDTSSSKHLYNIFQRLNAVNERGQHVRVNWHFETGDEEMAETGKDYQSLFQLDFNFVEVRELF